MSVDDDYKPEDRTPHLLSQGELSDLNPLKRKAEIFGSRIQQRNLLHPNTRISCYRQRQNDFTTFFKIQDGLVVKD